MASGGRRVVIQQRERAVSADANRLQVLQQAELVGVLKHLVDGRALYDDNAGGTESLGSVEQSPLRAAVFGGLRVRPEIGTVNLFVEPGSAVLVRPDAPADPDDDAAYKWVVDPGVQVAGQLVLTANASGSARIDVVECQPSDVLLETAVRDVFDPGTGTFSPQLVEKVRARRLSYRIRLGTPGAGFPGTALGWLPLAVCSVPNGAANWDAVIVWDVRPLSSDRLFAPFAQERSRVAWYGKQHVSVQIDGAPPTNIRQRGQVEGSVLGMRAGGLLTVDGALAVGSGEVDVLAAANHHGSPFVANRPWYLWALFPFGLPRWCRLRPAGSGDRSPGAFRGIPVVSSVGPADVGGLAASAITLPAQYGFATGTTTVGAVILAGLTSSAAIRPWAVVADGRTQWLRIYDTPTNLAPAASAADSETWHLVDNTDVPATARAVYVTFQATIPNANVFVRHRVALRNLANTDDEWVWEDAIYFKPGVQPHTDRWTVRVPYHSTVVDSPGLKTRRIVWTHELGAQGQAVAAPTLTIRGWELGP